jgi:hypothetical protein
MSTHTAAPARAASAAQDTPRRGLLTAAATTAAVATAANLAIWALTDALVDVPERFTPLQPGSVVFMTLLGVALAAGFLRLLAGRTDRPAETFRRIVPVALVLSLIPDIGIWASGAYEGAAEAQTVLPLMAMHVVAAAAAWRLLPTAFSHRSQ